MTLKTALTMCVGVPFGYLVDFFVYLWSPTLLVWQKCIALVLGIAIVINLISTGGLACVGISSVVSVLLTGRFVGMSYRLLPQIRMAPFFSVESSE